MYVYIYMCIYICMYVCIYICIDSSIEIVIPLNLINTAHNINSTEIDYITLLFQCILMGVKHIVIIHRHKLLWPLGFAYVQ